MEARYEALERDWVESHQRAANEVIDFFAGDGISLEGLMIADVGCGDGLIDLALATTCQPAMITGFDLTTTNTELLSSRAKRYFDLEGLPANLDFQQSSIDRIPAEDASFDLVMSWSTFEHVSELDQMASEILRVLKPQGKVFIQLWPFYSSQWGSHLWDFAQPFEHLQTPVELLQARARETMDHDNPFHQDVLGQSEHLNRTTLDELQRAFVGVGLKPRKVELYSEATHIPDELAAMPLSVLMVSGVKMILSAG